MIYISMIYLLLFSALFLLFSFIYNTFRAKKEGGFETEATIKEDNQNDGDKDIEI